MEAGAEVWIKDIQGREAWIPAVVISKVKINKYYNKFHFLLFVIL